jgi:hypothetical protein
MAPDFPRSFAPGLRGRVAAAVLLAVLFALDLACLPRLSLTYDEPGHLQYGINVLHGDSDRFDDSKMPVSALNALPAVAAERLREGPLRRALASPEAARLSTAIAGLLLALLVYRWAGELYGGAAALLALFLCALDPNLIAHSQLVTTDLYAALGVAATFYGFWRLDRRRTPGAAVFAALALALAQLAKYTCIFLYPLLAVAALAAYGGPVARALADRDRPRLRRQLRAALGVAALIATATLLVVNLGFLGNRTFTPFGRYEFRSELFRRMQSLPGLRALPVPLPYPYLQGIDLVRFRERGGKIFGRIYLCGQLRENEGFKAYYLYAYLFKTPLGGQLLFFLAAAAYALRRRSFRFRRDEIWMLAPALAFWIYFDLLYKAQIGIRYLLVAFPLMHVFTGSLLAAEPVAPEVAGIAPSVRRRPAGAARRAAIAGIAGISAFAIAASVLAAFPDGYISYFNELVPDRGRAYEILADSNLDWGQDEAVLVRYLAAHPEVSVNPPAPVPGRLVIGANFLTGVMRNGRYGWLRHNFEPVGAVTPSHLIFEIAPAELERLGITTPRPGDG